MNWFDVAIIHFLNSFARRSLVFDSIMVLMTDSSLLEGGLIIVLFWWAWSKAGTNSKEREFLLFSLFAGAFSVLAARTLALTLPFRERPLDNSLLNFKLPYSMDLSTWINWSSFPSDHSVLWFCMAMGVWLVSKRLGIWALLYALLGASFPRVYLGVHYPTDVLAGAVLGIAIACLVKVDWLRNAALHPVLYWQEHHPQSFAAFLFLFSFEIAEQFDSARIVGITGYHLTRHVVQTHLIF